MSDQNALADPITLFDAIAALETGDASLVQKNVPALKHLLQRHFIEPTRDTRTVNGSELSNLKKEIIKWTRKRAVKTIVAWQSDKRLYQEMPGRIIDKWFEGNGALLGRPTIGQAICLAIEGLENTAFRAKEETLKRLYYSKDAAGQCPTTPEIIKFYRLPDPSTIFFKPTLEMPEIIKLRLVELSKPQLSPAYQKKLKRYLENKAMTEVLIATVGSEKAKELLSKWPKLSI